MPAKLKFQCDLDLRPSNLKFNRGHLPVMTNQHSKLENPWAMSSLVIDLTRFVYGLTDGPTFAKQIYPLFFKGGIINEPWN